MFYIIYNPFSGRKKNNKKEIEIMFNYLKENNIEHKIFETKYKNHPKEIANEITTNDISGSIIIIGGDGTINEVINGINNIERWNIGIIPVGSGNDFANALKLPLKKPLEALKIILNNNVEKVDYVLANGDIALNIFGTGIDVEVLQYFEKHKKLHGKFRYLVSLIEAIIKIKWYDFEVSVDDKEFEKKHGLVMAICNGHCYGGGIKISPLSNPQDGLIDFVFIEQMKKIKIPGFFLKLLKGKINEIKQYSIVSCKKIVIKCDEGTKLQLDGNIITGQNTYSCQIVKGGLNIYK